MVVELFTHFFNFLAQKAKVHHHAGFRVWLACNGHFGVIRVAVDAQAFNTLQLTAESRAVLKGEVAVMLRESVSSPAERKPRKSARLGAVVKAPINLDSEGLLRYSALKAWRAEVAQEHNLPAYVIFHDATLAAIAQRAPQTIDDLQGISGIGAKKLEAYADDVLKVVALQ